MQMREDAAGPHCPACHALCLALFVDKGQERARNFDQEVEYYSKYSQSHQSHNSYIYEQNYITVLQNMFITSE